MAALTINQGDTSPVVTGCKMARMGAREEGWLILLGGFREHSPIVYSRTGLLSLTYVLPLLPLFFESSLAFSLSLSSLLRGSQTWSHCPSDGRAGGGLSVLSSWSIFFSICGWVLGQSASIDPMAQTAGRRLGGKACPDTTSLSSLLYQSLSYWTSL